MRRSACPRTRPDTVLANEMLASVFRNLLNNAVQHNDTDAPEVTVTCEETDDRIRVRVADNGPGVPDAEKTRYSAKARRVSTAPAPGSDSTSCPS